MLFLALAALFFLIFNQMAQQSLLWYGGFALSLVLSFLVTTLSVGEGSDQAAEAQLNLISRLKQQESQLKKEAEKLTSDVTWLQELCQEKEKQIANFEVQSKEESDKAGFLDLQLKEVKSALQKKDQEIKEVSSKLAKSLENCRSVEEKVAEFEKVKEALLKEKEGNLLQLGKSEEVKSALEKKIVETEGKIEAFSKEKEQLLDSHRIELANREESIQALKLQLEEKAASLTKSEIEPESEPESQNYKALFMQLRGQFEEKQNLLDATRKELFHASEDVAALRLAQKEDRKYSCNPQVMALEKVVVQLGESYESLEKRSREEIMALQDLVTALTN